MGRSVRKLHRARSRSLHFPTIARTAGRKAGARLGVSHSRSEGQRRDGQCAFSAKQFLRAQFRYEHDGLFRRIYPRSNSLEAYRRPPPRQSYLLSGHFRLDHPIFRRVGVPHVVITTLRDPIDRMLSNYNFTLRMPHNPWHDDVVTKGMSFLEYAANMTRQSARNTVSSTTLAEAHLPRPAPPRRRNA